jgi:5-methyltetrahydropteroyltriglutamate--homocysteine methyltransferase
MLGEGIEWLNAIPGTPGVTFAMHLCRSNLPAPWMAKGGDDAISKQVFARATNFDVFVLEYDDWRSGSSEPLADIPRTEPWF